MEAMTIKDFFGIVGMFGGGIMLLYEMYQKLWKKPIDDRFEKTLETINIKIADALKDAIQPLTSIIDKLTVCVDTLNSRIGKIEVGDELQKKEFFELTERVARIEENQDFAHKRLNEHQDMLLTLQQQVINNDK